MKTLLIILLSFSNNAFAECKWSKKEIFNKNIPSINWRYCKNSKGKTIVDVSGIKIKPTKSFTLNYPTCPECKEMYSTPSKNKELTVISMRNSEYDSNVWVLDIKNKKILYFSSEVHGKHILFEWKAEHELIITHAGMGYGTEYYVKPTNEKWAVYKTKELKDLL